MTETKRNSLKLRNSRFSIGRKVENMSEYRNEGRCHECDATGGSHYPGCSYEGTEGRCRLGGSGLGKFFFMLIFLFGIFVAALCPPLGVGIIVLGAKITGV